MKRGRLWALLGILLVARVLQAAEETIAAAQGDTSATAPALASATANGKAGAVRPDVLTAVRTLQEAVCSAAADHELVKAAEELTAACAASAATMTAASAAAALEALALAASVASAAIFRGSLILERGRLLDQLARPGAAAAAVEAALLLLRSHPLPTGGHLPSRASSDPNVLGLQRWVVGRLLRATRVLHSLGKEQAVHDLLAPLPAAAAALSDPMAYVSAMGQLTSLTDGQLEELQHCTGMLDDGGRAPPPAGDAPTTPCPWLAGVNHIQAFPLFYSLHRGLHARKRYGEAWAALMRAKQLHGPGSSYQAEDYAALLQSLGGANPPTARGEGGGPGHQQQHVAGGPALQVAAVAGTQAWQALMGAADLASRYGLRLREEPAAAAAAAAAGPTEIGAHPASGQCTPLAAADAPLLGPRPILVAGLPRSGSALIEQILSSHPSVWGACELARLPHLVSKLLLAASNGTVSSKQIVELREQYMRGVGGMLPPEVATSSTSWHVDRNLGSVFHLGYLAAMLPGACIIHAVWHPADAALSALQQAPRPAVAPWSFNLSHLAAHVSAHHAAMAHWDAALPGRVLHLHYSQMVADMEGATRRMLEHCGLPWHPSMMRLNDVGHAAASNTSQHHLRRPAYSPAKWAVYKEGLAPLLLQLREVILEYEQAAGLPSSQQLLDSLPQQTQQPQAQEEQQPEEVEKQEAPGAAAAGSAERGREEASEEAARTRPAAAAGLSPREPPNRPKEHLVERETAEATVLELPDQDLQDCMPEQPEETPKNEADKKLHAQLEQPPEPEELSVEVPAEAATPPQMGRPQQPTPQPAPLEPAQQTAQEPASVKQLAADQQGLVELKRLEELEHLVKEMEKKLQQAAEKEAASEAQHAEAQQAEKKAQDAAATAAAAAAAGEAAGAKAAQEAVATKAAEDVAAKAAQKTAAAKAAEEAATKAAQEVAAVKAAEKAAAAAMWQRAEQEKVSAEDRWIAEQQAAAAEAFRRAEEAAAAEALRKAEEAAAAIALRKAEEEAAIEQQEEAQRQEPEAKGAAAAAEAALREWEVTAARTAAEQRALAAAEAAASAVASAHSASDAESAAGAIHAASTAATIAKEASAPIGTVVASAATSQAEAAAAEAKRAAAMVTSKAAAEQRALRAAEAATAAVASVRSASDAESAHGTVRAAFIAAEAAKEAAAVAGTTAASEAARRAQEAATEAQHVATTVTAWLKAADAADNAEEAAAASGLPAAQEASRRAAVAVATAQAIAIRKADAESTAAAAAKAAEQEAARAAGGANAIVVAMAAERAASAAIAAQAAAAEAGSRSAADAATKAAAAAQRAATAVAVTHAIGKVAERAAELAAAAGAAANATAASVAAQEALAAAQAAEEEATRSGLPVALVAASISSQHAAAARAAAEAKAAAEHEVAAATAAAAQQQQAKAAAPQQGVAAAAAAAAQQQAEVDATLGAAGKQDHNFLPPQAPEHEDISAAHPGEPPAVSPVHAEAPAPVPGHFGRASRKLQLDPPRRQSQTKPSWSRLQ